MSFHVNEAAARAGAADRGRTTGTTKVVSLAAARARVKSDAAPSIHSLLALKVAIARGLLEVRRNARAWQLTRSEALWAESELEAVGARLTARVRNLEARGGRRRCG
jgi:hypothetical protein